MPQQTITVEANTLEQAKELLKTRVPEGFQIISEEIITDDIPKVMNISGDSSELALEKLKTRLPVDAELIEWKEITPAERKLISVDAEDEQSAQTQALFNIIGKRPTIKRVSIISKGSKGFLGIGKKLNQYQVEIFHEANIEATYRTKAKISATIVKLEPPEIAELVDIIDNIWKGDADQIAAAEKLSKQGGKDAIEPLLKLAKNEEIKVRGIAISALEKLKSLLNEQTLILLDQAIDKYQNDNDLIEQQIEPLLALLKPMAALGANRGSEFQRLDEQIREIGKKINEIGGHSGMWIPYNQIRALSPYPPLGSILESRWDGIGSWQR